MSWMTIINRLMNKCTKELIDDRPLIDKQNNRLRNIFDLTNGNLKVNEHIVLGPQTRLSEFVTQGKDCLRLTIANLSFQTYEILEKGYIFMVGFDSEKIISVDIAIASPSGVEEIKELAQDIEAIPGDYPWGKIRINDANREPIPSIVIIYGN